jgi:hypothetical protein
MHGGNKAKMPDTVSVLNGQKVFGFQRSKTLE